MKQELRFGKIIAALTLFAVLMLPTVVQFHHIALGHEHSYDASPITKIQKEVPDCHICDFQLSSFHSNTFQDYTIAVADIHIEKAATYTSLLLNSFRNPHTQLRAPPHILS